MASIINGLFAGRAGISAHGAAIAVLSDNIANANTPGFKPSRAEFTDLVAGLSSGGSAVGSGSATKSVRQVFSQGTPEATGRSLDVAIEGNGFFVVSDGTSQFYTRAGNLSLDSEGFLVSQSGLRVLGFSATGAGGLETLNVNNFSQTNAATSEVQISGNLNAAAAITAVPGGTPTFAQLNNAASFSTRIDVFDSLGASHTVSTYFFKTAPNTWQARAYVDGGEVTGGTAGTPSLVGAQATINFNTDGTRVPAAVDIAADPINWSNGSAAGAIDLSFTPLTQFSSSSTINSVTQDGIKGSGSVTSFSVQTDGTLFAQLSNGQTSSIGQIALATFGNIEGLKRIGNSLYETSGTSGEPVMGTPGSGQFGKIVAGALELSTADLATDFVTLISLQRGFQGSSRVITSINDLMNEILNLAR